MGSSALLVEPAAQRWHIRNASQNPCKIYHSRNPYLPLSSPWGKTGPLSAAHYTQRHTSPLSNQQIYCLFPSLTTMAGMCVTSVHVTKIQSHLIILWEKHTIIRHQNVILSMRLVTMEIQGKIYTWLWYQSVNYWMVFGDMYTLSGCLFSWQNLGRNLKTKLPGTTPKLWNDQGE